MQAFQDRKSLLSSSEILAFPDFNKLFILTEASDFAIGAVLSQGDIGKDRPNAYLSRSLNNTEENYANKEKEMLAIVSALDSLWNYLNEAKKIRIYTDYKSLTFALGSCNYNTKFKSTITS